MLAANGAQQAGLVNFLQYLVSSYFLSDTFCTVIYYDRILTSVQHGCDQYCAFLMGLEIALAGLNGEQRSVMWITAESGEEAVKLEYAIEEGCQSFIVITRDVMNFLKLKLDLKETSTQRMRDKNLLIYYENNTMLDSSDITREILNFYPNLWFLVQTDDENFDVYTQNYTVNSTDVHLVDSYNIIKQSFNSDGHLFYDKLYNLHGRIVTVGVTEYTPYCVTTKTDVNQGNADAFNSSLAKELLVRGTEGILIVEFCKIRNCNLRVWPYGPSDWGDIYANGSGYGEIFSTYSKQTEFAICCLYYNWFLHLLDGSQYIAKSTVTVMVPGARLLPMSLTVIYPFSGTVWLSIFIMLLVTTAIHHLITSLNLKHDDKSVRPPIAKSIFDMISIYLDQGIFPNSVSSSYRWLVSFILLSGVVISNSYSSGLASVLTVPKYGKSIETIDDFVQTPFRWGAPAIAWVLSLYGADSYDIQKVVEKFDIVADEDALYQRSLAGDYGVGVELLNGGNYAYGSFIREDNVRSFDILKEELYYTYTIGYSQRGWPLMEYFNKFNLEAIQHGFLIFWEEQAIRNFTAFNVEQTLLEIAKGHNEKEELKPLTVKHVLGSLWILMIGSIASTAVFLCELLWYFLQKYRDRKT
ncbi:uncharacterized protein LOC129725140 [Wyeomyia smithii]|uniref:uncharacterized protein LOC129725140 n=1 Tax=Wyeomyia smithii TaxID=174621 RepID=UPI002467F682|nr:uncharacterized protein LOC129725140 [Wyeomyia smithii]